MALMKEFVDWYSNQGEQDFGNWLEIGQDMEMADTGYDHLNYDSEVPEIETEDSLTVSFKAYPREEP